MVASRPEEEGDEHHGQGASLGDAAFVAGWRAETSGDAVVDVAHRVRHRRCPVRGAFLAPVRRSVDTPGAQIARGYFNVGIGIRIRPCQLSRNPSRAPEAFAVVDGFPGTPHGECLAHFVRRGDGDASAA